MNPIYVEAIMYGAFAVGALVFLLLAIAIAAPPDDDDRPSGGGMLE